MSEAEEAVGELLDAIISAVCSASEWDVTCKAISLRQSCRYVRSTVAHTHCMSLGNRRAFSRLWSNPSQHSSAHLHTHSPTDLSDRTCFRPIPLLVDLPGG